MAKLILSLDGQVIKDYAISKERMTIGRKPHNDVQIDNLAVSGEHAMIMTILNDSFLEDLGSTNGTMVNGQPVKKHFLQNDDVVEIGKYKIKYVNEQAGKVSQQEFEKTMVLRAPVGGAAPKSSPSDTQTNLRPIDTQTNAKPLDAHTNPQTSTVPGSVASSAMEAAGSQPMAAAAEAPAAAAGAIQILSGPNAGRELPLSKPLTTVGKPGIQVAVIAKRPQGYFLTHVEGASFPVVNGKALDAQAHQLKDHDIIELAGVKMEFFLNV